MSYETSDSRYIWKGKGTLRNKAGKTAKHLHTSTALQPIHKKPREPLVTEQQNERLAQDSLSWNLAVFRGPQRYPLPTVNSVW